MWSRTVAFAGILLVGLLSVGGLSFGDTGIGLTAEGEAAPNVCRALDVGCCDPVTTLAEPERCLI